MKNPKQQGPHGAKTNASLTHECLSSGLDTPNSCREVVTVATRLERAAEQICPALTINRWTRNIDTMLNIHFKK